jgi:hypothetical protein
MRIETVERQADHRHALPVQRHAAGVSVAASTCMAVLIDVPNAPPGNCVLSANCPARGRSRSAAFTISFSTSRICASAGLRSFSDTGVASREAVFRTAPDSRARRRARRSRAVPFPRCRSPRRQPQSRRHGLSAKRAREPAFMQILIRARAGVPYLDRSEMREIRLRVTDALHDRQLPVFPERHQWLHGGMQGPCAHQAG